VRRPGPWILAAWAALALPACDQGLSPKALQGSYQDHSVEVAGLGQSLVLDLKPDGNALLTHDFHHGLSPVVDFGLWDVESGQVAVSFLEKDPAALRGKSLSQGGRAQVAGTITFKIRDEGRRLVSTGPEAWDFQKQ
jgi:hypothetical protein